MEAYREKIEQYGSTMESMGLTPVAARVFVFLLFSEQGQSTFEQILSYFNVSKSAVSNALKLLAAVNMIEGKTVGGKRKRYFQVSFQKMLDVQELSSRFRTYVHMLEDIGQSRQSQTDAFAKELTAVSGLYKLMMIELPLILERWKQMNSVNLANSSNLTNNTSLM
ncbi:helix-turn-helix domain-containing protein [Cytophagaceae bacterium DM2B3-1]|uniref:Helix-turn-helix domain-containing protein n=1 Tax=Xanthocytophaga flava TaxID=3048013 RepID=A0ABT7CY32_9BACT|nr:helix-turn-helix domain-containing protein [Xanthocytophaga flavus]MDJ1498657.1 helix-turn-helix domain-containing protein [Xanthocytophaga flavus]